MQQLSVFQMARVVSAVGILKKMDHGDQSAVKEKL
jgi:hypothetical protein